MSRLDKDALAWVVSVVGDEPNEVRALRDDGSPWLLTYPDRTLVLRVGRSDLAATEAIGLRFAAQAAVAAPELVAADTARGRLLISAIDGASTIPRERPQARLRTLGACAAALHAIAVPDDAGLQRRSRPIEGVDFAALRSQQPPHPLFVRGEEIVRDHVPTGADGFVHGDLWEGNAMWVGDELQALIDWDCSGFGPAGVDLGSLRSDAIMCFGLDAADDVLAGWEQQAGRAADDVAYWDVVAALCSPLDMGWFTNAIRGQGRDDLTSDELIRRRDAYLEQALSAFE